MKRWRWPTVMLLPVLLTGCSFISGLSPYAYRPTCATAGATPERKASPNELSEKYRLDGNCYYKLLIVDKDDSAGWAKGHVPKTEIEWNKKQPDKWSFRNAYRRMLNLDNVPLDIYKFQVENGVKGINLNEVAYFVKEPDKDALTFKTKDEMCALRDQLIQNTIDKFYKNLDYPIKVPADLKQECPKLKDEYTKSK